MAPPEKRRRTLVQATSDALLQRRPIELSPDEARLYELTLFPLTRRGFRDLVRLGHWENLQPGDVLLCAGQTIGAVAVPLSDSVEARIGGQRLGRFAAGEIVGASAFTPHLPQVEAVAREACRVLRLPVERIRQLARRDDQLARTLERIAREDLARKLERATAQPRIPSPAAGPAP